MRRLSAIMPALLAALTACEPEQRDFHNPYLTINAHEDLDGDGVPNGDDPDPRDPSCADIETDVNHCGECGRRCSDELPNAEVSCEAGACAAGACLAGWSDVNQDLSWPDSDGCECPTDDPLTDVNHCGECGHACPALKYHVAAPTCSEGACAYACEAGFSDADHDLGESSVNGCECQTEDPLTDADHCGTLCLHCPERTHADRACVDGACTHTCHPTWQDANGDLDDAGSDGCEAWKPSCDRVDLGSGEDAVPMCLVPAGDFTMGCARIPWGCAANEEPEHEVTHTGDIWIDSLEVTRARFRAFVQANPDWSPAGRGPAGARCDAGYLGGWKGTEPPAGTEGHPVVEVCWFAAAAYCEWAGKKLPTEAEWEYAARGFEVRRFPWGDAEPGEAHANCAEWSCADGNDGTAAAGEFEDGASEFGLLDMSGNAREWVADWFGYYGPDPAEDPAGPDVGEDRMIRGGCFEDGGEELRVTRREWAASASVDGTTGFRCAWRDGS